MSFSTDYLSCYSLESQCATTYPCEGAAHEMEILAKVETVNDQSGKKSFQLTGSRFNEHINAHVSHVIAIMDSNTKGKELNKQDVPMGNRSKSLDHWKFLLYLVGIMLHCHVYM